MSIHRPKRPSTRKADAPSRGSSASSTTKPPKWKDVVADRPDNAFAPYASASRYEKDALIAHSKFGKGIVVEVDGNKVHILFEQGVLRLLHGTP